MERLLVLREQRFDGKKDMLLYIAQELDFPDYFGNNLDALYDCLCDIDDCTNISFDPMPQEDSAEWYKKVAEVVFDAARDNENIKIFRQLHFEADE